MEVFKVLTELFAARRRCLAWWRGFERLARKLILEPFPLVLYFYKLKFRAPELCLELIQVCQSEYSQNARSPLSSVCLNCLCINDYFRATIDTCNSNEFTYIHTYIVAMKMQSENDLRRTGLPDFSSYKIPKRGKNIPKFR
jgi:hypothetical protein